MEGNAAWCCRIFSENILGAGPESSLLPSSWQGAVLQAQSPPSCWGGLGDPLTGGYESILRLIFFVPLAEVDHGSQTSWGMGNTAPRYQRSLPCCHLSQASWLCSLQAAPFHNPFEPVFSSRCTEQKIFGIALRCH